MRDETVFFRQLTENDDIMNYFLPIFLMFYIKWIQSWKSLTDSRRNRKPE